MSRQGHIVRAEARHVRQPSSAEKAARAGAAQRRASRMAALIAFGTSLAAWERAGSRGPRPVDPRNVPPPLTASPWRGARACMEASHWRQEERVGAAKDPER